MQHFLQPLSRKKHFYGFETYGHAAGDECLRKVAQALHKTPQRAADFVARYGGEEFATILPETNVDKAIMIAEKMRNNIAALSIPHEQNQAAHYVTISLGVEALIPNKNTSPTHLGMKIK